MENISTPFPIQLPPTIRQDPRVHRDIKQAKESVTDFKQLARKSIDSKIKELKLSKKEPHLIKLQRQAIDKQIKELHGVRRRVGQTSIDKVSDLEQLAAKVSSVLDSASGPDAVPAYGSFNPTIRQFEKMILLALKVTEEHVVDNRKYTAMANGLPHSNRLEKIAAKISSLSPNEKDIPGIRKLTQNCNKLSKLETQWKSECKKLLSSSKGKQWASVNTMKSLQQQIAQIKTQCKTNRKAIKHKIIEAHPLNEKHRSLETRQELADHLSQALKTQFPLSAGIADGQLRGFHAAIAKSLEPRIASAKADPDPKVQELGGKIESIKTTLYRSNRSRNPDGTSRVLDELINKDLRHLVMDLALQKQDLPPSQRDEKLSLAEFYRSGMWVSPPPGPHATRKEIEKWNREATLALQVAHQEMSPYLP